VAVNLILLQLAHKLDVLETVNLELSQFVVEAAFTDLADVRLDAHLHRGHLTSRLADTLAHSEQLTVGEALLGLMEAACRCKVTALDLLGVIPSLVPEEVFKVFVVILLNQK